MRLRSTSARRSPPAGGAQVGTDRIAEGRAPLRRPGGGLGHGWGGCSPRPARSTNPKARGRITGALARALFAAGFRAGDLVHNTFSYHFTPAGWMMEAAAQALGCTVFPAGVGQTEQQVAAIADLQPNGLRRHAVLPAHPARQGRRARRDLSFTKALVSGEAFPPRCAMAAARGIAGLPGLRHRRLGLIAYETRRARAWWWTRT
jgi:phenylacetate-CoA ligase